MFLTAKRTKISNNCKVISIKSDTITTGRYILNANTPVSKQHLSRVVVAIKNAWGVDGGSSLDVTYQEINKTHFALTGKHALFMIQLFQKSGFLSGEGKSDLAKYIPLVESLLKPAASDDYVVPSGSFGSI